MVFLRRPSGFNSQQIADGFRAWDDTIHADIFLVEVGTNDYGTGMSLDESRVANVELWTEIMDQDPNSVVYVASIPPCREGHRHGVKNSWIDRYNAMLKQTAEQFGKDHPRFYFADLHDGAHLLPSDFGPMGLHPNDNGYRKIAAFWSSQIEPMVERN